MAERTAVEAGSGGASLVPPARPVSGRVFCGHCAADVSALPWLARFCNRCGAALGGDYEPKARTIPAASPAPALPPDPEPFHPPLILVAYAKALFNLGCRYETAVGSRRNLDEAARCYWKAARLGDPAARERYGAEAAATATALLPYQPPPLPPGAAPYRESPPPFAAVHTPDVSGRMP